MVSDLPSTQIIDYFAQFFEYVDDTLTNNKKNRIKSLPSPLEK